MNIAPADPHDLDRFVTAQKDIFDRALSELRTGEKRSHWMWFIFPQVSGLGSSSMARRYAIRSRAEAAAYLQHPLLGHRLAECAEALLSVHDRSAEDIMGYPDYLKLQSSMTLFAEISAPGSVFARVLERYYAGTSDPQTLAFLHR